MCKNRNSLLKKYRQIYLSEDILLEQLRIEHDKEPYTVKNYDKKSLMFVLYYLVLVEKNLLTISRVVGILVKT